MVLINFLKQTVHEGMIIGDKSSFLRRADILFKRDIFSALLAENYVHELLFGGNVWIWCEKNELKPFTNFAEEFLAKLMRKKSNLGVNLLVSGHLIYDEAFFEYVFRR
jgi:hypothetical protein